MPAATMCPLKDGFPLSRERRGKGNNKGRKSFGCSERPAEGGKLFDQNKQNGPPKADKLFDQNKQNGPAKLDKLFH